MLGTRTEQSQKRPGRCLPDGTGRGPLRALAVSNEKNQALPGARVSVSAGLGSPGLAAPRPGHLRAAVTRGPGLGSAEGQLLGAEARRGLGGRTLAAGSAAGGRSRTRCSRQVWRCDIADTWEGGRAADGAGTVRPGRRREELDQDLLLIRDSRHGSTPRPFTLGTLTVTTCHSGGCREGHGPGSRLQRLCADLHTCSRGRQSAYHRHSTHFPAFGTGATSRDSPGPRSL